MTMNEYGAVRLTGLRKRYRPVQAVDGVDLLIAPSEVVALSGPAADAGGRGARVHAGLRVVDPTLAAESLNSGTSPLTGREHKVLIVAADGGTVANLARP